MIDKPDAATRPSLDMGSPLPLSALLSFAWTAFTIEVDNAFESLVPHSTTRGDRTGGPWLVSHAMWWTCMRHVGPDGIYLHDLQARAHAKTNLKGMIRWGYITLSPTPGLRDPTAGNPLILPTRKGLAAQQAWRSLPAEVESGWRQRFGDDAMQELAASLRAVIGKLDPDLPDCLPILGYGLTVPLPIPANQAARVYGEEDIPLAALLARVLLSFTIAFEAAAGLSLAIGANVLRLIEDSGTNLRDLPRRAGVSKEAIASAVGFLERRNMARLTTAGRLRVVQLTASGMRAKVNYVKLSLDIEAALRATFGAAPMERLRQACERIVGSTGAALLAGVVESGKTGWRSAIVPPDTLPWQPMVLHRGGFPDGS